MIIKEPGALIVKQEPDPDFQPVVCILDYIDIPHHKLIFFQAIIFIGEKIDHIYNCLSFQNDYLQLKKSISSIIFETQPHVIITSDHKIFKSDEFRLYLLTAGICHIFTELANLTEITNHFSDSSLMSFLTKIDKIKTIKEVLNYDKK